jgi:ABC-type sugar transport system permease subunit
MVYNHAGPIHLDEYVGYACAMAVVLMLGLGLVTFIQRRWIGSKVFYG